MTNIGDYNQTLCIWQPLKSLSNLHYKNIFQKALPYGILTSKYQLK